MPSSGRTFSSGDVLRARWVQSLDRAGVPLDGIAAAIEDGALSLSFMDVEAFDRFADITGTTFQQLSAITGYLWSFSWWFVRPSVLRNPCQKRSLSTKHHPEESGLDGERILR